MNVADNKNKLLQNFRNQYSFTRRDMTILESIAHRTKTEQICITNSDCVEIISRIDKEKDDTQSLYHTQSFKAAVLLDLMAYSNQGGKRIPFSVACIALLLVSSRCTREVYGIIARSIGLPHFDRAHELLDASISDRVKFIKQNCAHKPSKTLAIGMDNLVIKQFIENLDLGAQKYLNFINSQTLWFTHFEFNFDCARPINCGRPNPTTVKQLLENGFIIKATYRDIRDHRSLDQSLYSRTNTMMSTHGPSSSHQVFIDLLNKFDTEFDFMKQPVFLMGDTEYINMAATVFSNDKEISESESRPSKYENVGLLAPFGHIMFHLLGQVWSQPLLLLAVTIPLLLDFGNLQRGKFEPIMRDLYAEIKSKVDSELLRRGKAPVKVTISIHGVHYDKNRQLYANIAFPDNSFTHTEKKRKQTVKLSYHHSILSFANSKDEEDDEGDIDIDARERTYLRARKSEEEEEIDTDFELTQAEDKPKVAVADEDLVDYCFYLTMYCLLGIRQTKDECAKALMKPKRMANFLQDIAMAFREPNPELELIKNTMREDNFGFGKIWLDCYEGSIINYVFTPIEDLFLHGNAVTMIEKTHDYIKLFSRNGHLFLNRAFSYILYEYWHWHESFPERFSQVLANCLTTDLFSEFTNSILSQWIKRNASNDLTTLQKASLEFPTVRKIRHDCEGKEAIENETKFNRRLASGIIHGCGEQREVYGTRPYGNRSRENRSNLARGIIEQGNRYIKCIQDVNKRINLTFSRMKIGENSQNASMLTIKGVLESSKDVAFQHVDMSEKHYTREAKRAMKKNSVNIMEGFKKDIYNSSLSKSELQFLLLQKQHIYKSNASVASLRDKVIELYPGGKADIRDAMEMHTEPQIDSLEEYNRHVWQGLKAHEQRRKAEEEEEKEAIAVERAARNSRRTN